jgi:NTE family protein
MDIIANLRKVELFNSLSEPDLKQLSQLFEQQQLAAGHQLYASGDNPDHFYILLYGRLCIYQNNSITAYINRYQPAGEFGMLSGEPHHADVYALRDSLLLKVNTQAFLDFIAPHPAVMLALSRLTIKRSQVASKQQHIMQNGRTLSIVPTSADVPAVHLAEALTTYLKGWPNVRLVTAAHVDALFGEGFSQTMLDYGENDLKLRAWLSSLEDAHCYVLYVAQRSDDTWALRCLHQADRILILAQANHPPENMPIIHILKAQKITSPLELVLLRAVGDPSPYTLSWKSMTGARAHYFVHPWAANDMSALARQITSKGLGLVLGGGGARGFAHIGLIRALEQLHIPVDIVGGTSMGAFIAALVACGFDSVEMAHIAYETFVARNYLNDYTMPRVSLIRGQRFHDRLHAIFGHQQIEELRQTFYCISTNLTTGEPVVHDQGELATWVGSSMSVPGVAPPIAWHENLLCDGGVINNLPTDVMQHLERGVIIASNVSMHGDVRAPGAGLDAPDQTALLNWHKVIKDKLLHAPRLAEILMRTATLASDTSIQTAAIARANLHIRMPIEGIGMFDWHRLDDLIDRGYQHALSVLEPMRDHLYD